MLPASASGDPAQRTPADNQCRSMRYNYKAQDIGSPEPEELPGVSCFLRDEGQVFHTYSTYARGTDILGSSYSLLDLTALGRQEDWEQPAGRAPRLHGADPTFTD